MNISQAYGSVGKMMFSTQKQLKKWLILENQWNFQGVSILRHIHIQRATERKGIMASAPRSEMSPLKR